MSILGNPILMGGNGGGGGANIQSLSVTQNGTYTASGAVDGYSPVVVSVSGGGAADCWWRVRYYSKSGSALIHTEYVQNGGDAEYGEGKSWSAVPNGEAVSGILENISGNLDVYSLQVQAVRISTKTITNATITVELGTYDTQTSTFTKESSSNIVWNSSSVLTYSTSIPNPALPYVRNGFLTLWYCETGSGATATWRTAAYTDTVYSGQTYSSGTQITHWTAETSKSGLLFYQA